VTAPLTPTRIFLLAAASAVVTANAYYIHPIIAPVAESFGVSQSVIGLVPALNQWFLALGIFLLLPLGDRFSNKRLVTIFCAGQTVFLGLMLVAEQFWLFTLGSALLGFCTIAPYLLPAYASKRVDPARLGQVTAILTTGVIAGILFARAGGGVIGEYFGWRAVYVVAATLMLTVSILLPLIMDEREHEPEGDEPPDYARLVLSIVPIVRRHPTVLISGAIQGLGFGIFLVVWLGLGLHLTSESMGYGVDVVGYLAGFSLINMLSTPWLGSWADKVGARRARVFAAAVHGAGILLLLPFGHSLWLLMIPILLTNVVGPTIDVTGRMTFLSQPAEVRTRLMTVYIVMMFLGGGLSSWIGTTAYDLAGWTGTAVLAILMSAAVMALSLWDLALEKRRAAPSPMGLDPKGG